MFFARCRLNGGSHMSEFLCPKCRSRLMADPRLRGQTVACPYCAEQFAMPGDNLVVPPPLPVTPPVTRNALTPPFMVYAGFWKRAAAGLIDVFVVLPFELVVAALLALSFLRNDPYS